MLAYLTIIIVVEVITVANMRSLIVQVRSQVVNIPIVPGAYKDTIRSNMDISLLLQNTGASLNMELKRVLMSAP